MFCKLQNESFKKPQHYVGVFNEIHEFSYKILQIDAKPIDETNRKESAKMQNNI